MTVAVIALMVGAYLLGSLNGAVLVARAQGVDIRAEGSGNPGASNIYRILGKGPAILVYLIDLLKGAVPALVGVVIGEPATGAAAGLLAVIGHCYPVFFRFQGGKGVATGGGALAVVCPPVMAGAVVLYLVLVALTKTSAIGSLVVAVLVLPGLALTGHRGWVLIWFGIMLALIIFRHRSNLVRLWSGTENRVSQ